MANAVSNYSNSNFNSSYTNYSGGLASASDLFDGHYEDGRRKVIILFTDGIPANSGDSYTQSFAENAIKDAKALKDKGVDIFTVGIFNGADPAVTYGSLDYFKSIGLRTTNIGQEGECDIYAYSNGTVGSQWMTNGTDDARSALANRILNYVSSNFPTAESVGVTDASHRYVSGWFIVTLF